MQKLTSLLLFLTAFTLYSQENFQAGYYIDNLDNKISGYINILDWENTPGSFDFKKDLQGPMITLSAVNAKKVGIGDYLNYERHNVLYDKSSFDLNNLTTTREPEFTKATLFLKSLIGIENDLLKYTFNGRDFFFIKKNGAVEYLVYKKYIQEDNKTAVNNYYKQQLATNYSCSNGDDLSSNNLSYNEKSIGNFFNTYLQCNDIKPNYNFIDTGTKIKVGIKVLAGFQNSSYDVNSFVRRTFDYGSNSGIVAGIELESISSSKWSVFLDARYYNFESSGAIDVFFPTTNETLPIPTSASYSAVDAGLGIRHQILTLNDFRMFIGANLAVDFITDAEIRFNEPGIPDFIDGAGNLGVGLGIGAKYKNFGTEFRINTPREILNQPSTDSTFNIFTFTISYQILKF